ncbi:MAG: hypothetical protein HUJ96_08875 [Marinilabiliaceae bacterium]|nr:hypothetical protein [Marinilabiliaceae bacterium]
MQKIVTYIVFVIVSLLTCQLSASPNQVDSIIQVNSKGVVVARSYFEYDANFYQTMAMHYTLNKKNGNWVGTFKETAEYDNDGNITKRITSYWDIDGSKWSEMSREINTYDREGRLTGVNQLKWILERSRWIGSQRYEREINERGFVTNHINYTWNNDNDIWTKSNQCSSEYDAYGRIHSTTNSEWKDSTWLFTTRETFTYKENTRRQTSSLTERWKNGSWVKYHTTESSYIEESNHISKRIDITKTYDDSGSTIRIRRNTTSYDDNNQTIGETEETFTEGRWITNNKWRSNTSYDNDGNCIAETRMKWQNGYGDNEKWEGVSKVLKTFNDYGDVMSEERYSWDNTHNAWKGINNEQYDYDNLGNIILHIRQRWNPVKKQWEMLSKMAFEYDDNHNKIRETTASWDKIHEEWDEFFIGKTDYIYDGEDNIKVMSEYMYEDNQWKLTKTTYNY